MASVDGSRKMTSPMPKEAEMLTWGIRRCKMVVADTSISARSTSSSAAARLDGVKCPLGPMLPPRPVTETSVGREAAGHWPLGLSGRFGRGGVEHNHLN